MELRPSAKAYIEKVGKKESIILEAGIYRGYNSKELYRAINCKIMYLIDKWYTSYEGGKYVVPEMLEYAKTAMSFFDGCDNVMIIKADSLLFPLWPDDYFDYIYLDNDHSYEHCKKEFAMYWKLLKHGGLISGDNLEAPGVRLALDEFCQKYNLEYETKPWKVNEKTGQPIASDWWIWKSELRTIFINNKEFRVDGDSITGKQMLELLFNGEYVDGNIIFDVDIKGPKADAKFSALNLNLHIIIQDGMQITITERN